MSWITIANYLAANWLEFAGVVTTVVGIWLSTRRLLICWPVVLAADLIYLVVFYGGTGGAACSRRARFAWPR
jgi:nicotinamide mononucleotide transporter